MKKAKANDGVSLAIAIMRLFINKERSEEEVGATISA